MKDNLYIMCGCPGSGKSTYAKQYFPREWYVSRDEIRFELVPADEEYFSKEDEVFSIFTQKIKDRLTVYGNAVADATHLNPKSRLKLISSISFPRDTQIHVIFIDTPLKKCIENNEKRKGTRSYVPVPVIKNMYNLLKKPSFEECYGLIDIVHTVYFKELMENK